MDTKALQLLSRFGIPPNSRGYCGKSEATEIIRNCIATGDCTGVVEQLKQFQTLRAYRELLAEIAGLDPFSYKVAEAYWIGNELLEKVPEGLYGLLLQKLGGNNLQAEPKRVILHHSFQVLWMGARELAGAVPNLTDWVNNCLVRWGKVVKTGQDEVKVEVNSITYEYQWVTTRETLPLDAKLTPDVEVGEYIAIHWRQIVKVLTVSELKNLIAWTNEVIESLR